MQISLRQRMLLVLCSSAVLTVVLELGVLRFRDLYIDLGEGSSLAFLDNFHEFERATPAEGGFSFQWSSTVSTVRLPHIRSRSPWVTTFRIHQRVLEYPERIIFSAGGVLIPIEPAPGTRSYEIFWPTSGPVTIESDLSRVVQENLQGYGIAVDYVYAQRVGDSLSVDGPVILFAFLSMGLAGALLALAQTSLRDSVLVISIVGALATFMLWRYPGYLLIALARTNALFGVVLSATATVSLLARSPRRRQWRPVISAILLSITLKMIGVLYPGYLPTDSIFHVHRLSSTILGEMFRTSEGQGQMFPYPVSAYVLLAPFALAYSDMRLLIQAAGVIIDSTTIALLAITLFDGSDGRKAAGWAGLLYAIMPAGFLFQWQNVFAQNIGQWFGVCYVTAMLYGIRHDRRTVGFYSLLTILSYLAATGHFGSFLNLSAAIVVMICVFPSYALQKKPFILTWFVGAILSFILFYSAYLQLFFEQSRNLTSKSQQPFSAHFFWLKRFVWEFGIHGHYLTLYVIVALATLVTLAIKRKSHPRVETPIYASMIIVSAVLAMLQVTIFLNATRFIIFAYPAIIIFSALAVSTIEKYRYGGIVVRLLVLYTVVSSVLMWVRGFALHERIGFLW